MRRLLPIPLALVFAFCAYAIQSVELPGRVVACSCRVPPTLAEMATAPNTVLVVATYGGGAPGGGGDPRGGGAPLGGGHILDIERVFNGNLPPQIRVQGFNGPSVGSDCSIAAALGQRWLLGVYRSPEGTFGVGTCGINALIGTAHGDALLAEAIGLFGVGQTPATPEPEPAAPVDLAPAFAGWRWLAALVLVSAAVFGGVLLVASRRRTP